MKQRLIALSAATAVAAGLAGDAFAASYASGLRNTGGNNYEFVLNEAATNVTINLGGGGTLPLGALGAGRHTFTATGSFDIAVSSASTAGYNYVDDTSNLFTSFERAAGLAINTIPSSPYFGTIYVNQNRESSTGAGRTMGNGIYSLTADRIGVELTDWSVPASANDPTLAKLPEPFATDVTLNENQGLISSSSFFRIGMDDAGNIIAGDWTNSSVLAGFGAISADLTTGGRLFAPPADPSQSGSNVIGAGGKIQVDGSGPFFQHGSIVGEPQVQGVWGQNLVVSAMDEDLDADAVFSSTGNNDANAVWRWNFGATTSGSTVRPELVIAPGDLYTSTGEDKNTSGVTFPAFSLNPAGTHSDGTPVFLDYNIGVMANAQYNAHFDKWYLSGARSNGDDSSNLVILTPEGPGGDGRDIQVDWASKQFSIDNGLDGFTDDPGVAVSLDPNNDIFRQAHNVTFSEDNTMMFLHRRLVTANNPVLGTGTDFGTKILGIPLDENGLPIIGVDDMGTPEDTSDDVITGIIPIDTLSAPTGQGTYGTVKTDAAGNVYFTENVSERLEYYSRGGSFLAVTGSAGTFSISELVTLAGDYNFDGRVDAADYTVWRDNPEANGGDGGYLTWANNYGATASSASVAVPEPSAVLLCLAALTGLAGRRNR